MHNKKMFRLGEYLITEFDNGQVQWEAHAALGMQRSGNCFILDNILIVGRCRDEDDGYLKMEFHGQLRKLPAWSKTAYYCFSFNLLDVITGQVLTEDFLQEVTTLAQIKGAPTNSVADMKHGTFRLGQYRINVAEDGNISWQSVDGIDKVIGGPCRIESNVLFICPQEYVREHQNKHDFLSALRRLTKWHYTIAWCRSMVLEECKPQQEARKSQVVATTENMRHKFIRDGKPSGHYEKQRREAETKTPLSSGFTRTFWRSILRSKALLKNVIPAALVAIVLLFGVTMIFYSIGKGCHMSHGNDDHHHKHDHEED